MEMDYDDDGPPLLVDSNGQLDQQDSIAAEMEELQMARVPITIITGMQKSCFFNQKAFSSLFLV